MLTRHPLMAGLLLSGLLALHAGAQAASPSSDEGKPAAELRNEVRNEAAACAEGARDCQRAAAATTKLAHAEREDVCAKGDQTCDSRGKEARARHADEARDRHACRD